MGVRVFIVPGAFYRENLRTGADGRIVREVAQRLGLPVEVVPAEVKAEQRNGLLWIRLPLRSAP